MARYVKVASVSFRMPSVLEKPEDQDVFGFMLHTIRKHIDEVLPDKPDLIVLPEMCDQPSNMSAEAVYTYYSQRGDMMVEALSQISCENQCYIAAGIVRCAPDGKHYNSCVMIDRSGNVMGYYNKNYITPEEKPFYDIVSGADTAVFNCDFGTVGAVLCFDLNFDELRQKYRDAKCDMVVFPSRFDGGLLCNIFAHETGAYFVKCFSGGTGRSAIIDPLGYPRVTSTNYYPCIFSQINLDYKICHLDENKAKFAAAKRKYGDKVKIHDNGFIGTVILSSESPDFTTQDIVDEFGIELREEYFNRARAAREQDIQG